MEPRTTTVAVPGARAVLDASGGLRPEVRVPRDVMGYVPLAADTCPACHDRAPSADPERFTLRQEKPLVHALELVLSPPAVVGAALSLRWVGDSVWWPLVFLFAPSMALAVARWARLGLRRFRLRVQLCPSCAADIRRERRRVWAWRTGKNLAAWAMVMMAPVAFTPLGEGYRALVGPVASLLAAATCISWVAERSARRRAARLLPTLAGVDPRGAALQLPPAWAGRVTARAAED